jgi:3-hydroxyacyl-[acyl-carrier-protein] dehydratase
VRPEKLLSDRKPWILIDEVIRYIPERQIVTKKFITTSDFFLIGHFPTYSVYPGMLLLEGLLQSAEMLQRLSNNEGVSKINAAKRSLNLMSCNARFQRPTEPGDTIEYTVTLESNAESVLGYHGIGVKNGNIAIRANWRAR